MLGLTLYESGTCTQNKFVSVAGKPICRETALARVGKEMGGKGCEKIRNCVTQCASV
jgi:hypothetical protein